MRDSYIPLYRELIISADDSKLGNSVSLRIERLSKSLRISFFMPLGTSTALCLKRRAISSLSLFRLPSSSGRHLALFSLYQQTDFLTHVLHFK